MLPAPTSSSSASAPNGRAGTSVAFVGDINDDRRPDYGVGAPLVRGGGQVAVVFGQGTPSGQTDLSQLGDRGFTIRGPRVDAQAGTSGRRRGRRER